MGTGAGTRGQSTVEWTGLLLLVALVLAAVLAAGVRVPGTALASTIAERLVCAAKLASCEDSPDAPLAAAYGEETAALVRRYAPEIRYERGMRALPVDFRRCRETACSDGAAAGRVVSSDAGEPVTAFVHVVARGGRTYIQYWLYYPDSATLRGVPVAGPRGYHRDDWESFQIRIGPGGRVIDARASSHHGYSGGQGFGGWASDAGIVSEPGWRTARGKLAVSGGSHAGQINGPPGPLRAVKRHLHLEPRAHRWTPASHIRLIPIESVRRGDTFAVTPPWRKRVYLDPEYAGTG